MPKSCRLLCEASDTCREMVFPTLFCVYHKMMEIRSGWGFSYISESIRNSKKPQLSLLTFSYFFTRFDKHKRKSERQKTKSTTQLRCFVPKTKDTSLGMNLGIFPLYFNLSSRGSKKPKTRIAMLLLPLDGTKRREPLSGFLPFFLFLCVYQNIQRVIIRMVGIWGFSYNSKSTRNLRKPHFLYQRNIWGFYYISKSTRNLRKPQLSSVKINTKEILILPTHCYASLSVSTRISKNPTLKRCITPM